MTHLNSNIRHALRALVPVLLLALTACGNSQLPAQGIAPPTPLPGAKSVRHRYAFNDSCVVLQDAASGKYIAGDGSYTAAADTVDLATAFYMKPSALGKYLLYTPQRTLLMNNGGSVDTIALDNAVDAAEWTLTGVGDETDYPLPAAEMDVEPDPARIAAYRAFVDPYTPYELFTLVAESTGQGLAVDAEAALVAAAQAGAMRLREVDPIACAIFPEAQSGASGEPFGGTLPDGSVLGMADVHVHMTSSTYLAELKSGWPYHKFGVTHAIGDCDKWHGPNGASSPVASAFGGNPGNHDTTGFPYFNEWPARGALTHEAIYWKWVERAWMGGLRLIVNDSVENETLCKIQRNAINQPNRDCDPMKSARRQMGTTYGLQDYIDAQYGGRGEGWFRIVHSPAEARSVIADGKLAVVMGMEISNVFNCKLTYNPARTDESGNSYDCAMTETGADNEIHTQLEHLYDIGMRQMFTVHEFDNAFGGNGIFDGTIFQLGNRENSGGIANDDLQGENTPAELTALFQPAAADFGTGEYWTTFDCPADDDPSVGGGYIFSPGTTIPSLGPPRPSCPYLGRRQFTNEVGMPGGATSCFRATARQCNARWLTPIGLYAYEKIMRKGLVFELDHLALEMKSQVLDLGEAQTPNYPSVSVHGGHGGISIAQAKRIYGVGGIVYPGLNNAQSQIGRLDQFREIHAESGAPYPLATGFGTDTNGLSGQSAPRGSIEAGKEVVYPYTLFSGPLFDDMPEFDKAPAVIFEQPTARDPDGNGRDWHIDQDGHAHYGMMSGFVQELRLEGTPQHMRELFLSAEMYIRTWERTLAARDGILQNGFTVPDGLIRQAPLPDPTGF